MMFQDRLFARLHAPAPEGAGGAAPPDEEINREIAAQYFSGAYSKKRMAWHRQRRVLELLRIAVVVLGLLICAGAVYLAWSEAGAADLNKLYAALGHRAFMLFTGALITVIGAAPWLWQFPWQLPMGVFALGMAVEMAVLDLGYRPLAIAMFLAAAGAIVYSWLLPRARAPLEDKDLEPKLDRWIDTIVKKLVDKAELPVSGNLGSMGEHVLKSFPKRERSADAEVLCKIGQDNRPRVTPLGVAVFDLRPATMVVFEGAIDLRSEAVIYARVHEFRYDDIIALLWSRDAIAPPRPAPAAAIPGAARARSQAASAPRHRDLLEIRLASGRSVSLVFSDSELLPPESVAKGGVKLIEDIGQIRRLWQEILDLQTKARPAPATA